MTRTKTASSILAIMSSLTAFSAMCENLGVCNIINMDIVPKLSDSLIKIEVWVPDEDETRLAYTEVRADQRQLKKTIKLLIGDIDRYLTSQDNNNNNKPIS